MNYKNLKVIGTSHIAKQSLEEIEQYIEIHKPEFIAVELDAKRLNALMSQEKRRLGFGDVRRIGVKGYMFVMIGGWLQRKLGGIAGMMPGSEMKLAVELARKHRLKIALIDRDIELTLRQFSKQLSWRERFRFIGDIFRAVFFKKREIKRMGLEKFDLTKVPDKELIKKLIFQLKERYPNIYDVLVAQRNQIMAKNLLTLMKMNPESHIMAVVGAGHEEGMMEIIKKQYNLMEVAPKRREAS